MKQTRHSPIEFYHVDTTSETSLSLLSDLTLRITVRWPVKGADFRQST